MPQPEAQPEADPAALADPAADPEADPFLFYSGLPLTTTYSASALPLTYSYSHLPLTYSSFAYHGLPYPTLLGRKKREAAPEAEPEAEPEANPEADPFLLYSAGLPLTTYHSALPLTYSTLKVAAPKITYKAAPITTYTATYPYGLHGLHGLPLVYGK